MVRSTIRRGFKSEINHIRLEHRQSWGDPDLEGQSESVPIVFHCPAHFEWKKSLDKKWPYSVTLLIEKRKKILLN